MSETGWRNRGARKEETRDKKRMLLLKTAARMFNEEGYDRTSLTSIARQLGITKPSLYYYVNSKEDILFNINKIAFEELKQVLDDTPSENANGREKLVNFLTRYIRVITSEFGKCIIPPNHVALSRESRNIFRQDRKYLDHAVRAIITEGIEDGSLVCSSPRLAVFSIFGAMNWMCFWYRADGSDSIEELTDAFVHFFLKGLEPR